MEASIQHLVDQNYKWIFVGGKGGVGKTTTSCSLGMIMSKYKESVLIISTDPASNISDAFDQKFSNEPSLVRGFHNLWAMEIDSEDSLNSFENNIGGNEGMLKDLMGTLPGIDEAISFAKIAELVESLKYSVVIFDTAPTGHTLRLLSFPISLSQTLHKFDEIKRKIFPLLRQIGSLMGSDFNLEPILKKIESAIPTIQKISEELKNVKTTTFVAVCIAEFLSMYETERLIQQLKTVGINVNTVIINQLVEQNNACAKCELCTSRASNQNVYVKEIEALYSNFHVMKCFLLPYEVRGCSSLKTYSKFLLNKD